MSRRVYVGGIPAEMSLEDIKKEVVMQLAGVKDVIVLMGDRQLNKGVGFVTFGTHEEAREAVAKGLMLGLVKTSLKITEEKRGREDEAWEVEPAAKRNRIDVEGASRVLVVNGFPQDTTDESLKALFSVHGEVEKVDMHTSDAKSPFALVTMTHLHQASRAQKELTGNLWRGASLRVDFSYEDRPDENPTTSTRVTIALDPAATGNHRVTTPQLLTMLAQLVENPDHGAFVDPNGHIVIPVTAFKDDEEDEESEE
eukprot:TRINITY_DN8322_c0_g2_i1.p1 TRINITY_DN8322_c0_g2~~TRINITY_DN8322_c0_g2_i1.p1  ORF type:complete len:267 (+),score=74.88 TRINITY_DN8322_c0_g2_i1:39-803(+)